MSNNALSQVIDKSYQTLLSLAANEVLQIMRYDGVCRPTKLRFAENDDKVTISADKVGKLAVVETTREHGYIKVTDISPTSLLTASEAETIIRSDSKHFLPIDEAVEILSRNTPEVHKLVKSYLSSKAPAVSISVQEVANLLAREDAGQARMLTALVTSIDDNANRHAADLTVNYKSFLKESPVGAEKIVRALRLVTTIVNKERGDLLLKIGDQKAANSELMKKVLGNSHKDYEAARKIVGKMCLTGAFYPVLLMKAAHIYSDIIMRPTYR